MALTYRRMKEWKEKRIRERNKEENMEIKYKQKKRTMKVCYG
jgi:hypothetical protein